LTWPNTNPESTEKKQTREVAIRNLDLLNLDLDSRTDPIPREISIRTNPRETSHQETIPPERALHSEKDTRPTDLHSRERKALNLPDKDINQEVPINRINSKEVANRENSETSEEAEVASNQDSDPTSMKETEEEKVAHPMEAMEEEAEVALEEEARVTTKEAQEEKMKCRAAQTKEMNLRRL